MRERVRVDIRGAVQGVGFRPFVYRLAQDLRLAGWVANSPQGVVIEWEGDGAAVEEALTRVVRDRPQHAVIHSLEPTWLDPAPYRDFEIRTSESGGEPSALVLPDLATCPDCLADIFDPANRRYRYPFTNCTNCGPRFTIIERLPYDRAHTSMRRFEMCPTCRREYDDPLNRRFHAQPNACPACGPRLTLWDGTGRSIATEDRALGAAVGALRAGLIVAVKGLGGFQLIVDAANGRAVARLRRLKRREEKPFAVMYPSLGDIARDTVLSEAEERLLASAVAPIVLVSRRRDISARLACEVAPNNPYLGAMVPYTPLHHLLLADFGAPVVATSGNLSEEPICIDEWEALDRLHAIADYFLVHDRPIVRHADDSIVRIVLGRELVMRRARGYAPLPIRIPQTVPPMIAVGGHLKNTVAIATGTNVFLTQHIGDLESAQSIDAFRATLASVQALYRVTPELVAADEHPDYVSTKHALTLGVPVVRVQHHVAHVASCMAENDVQGPVLGVAWDGTGYGDDGTIWGGEFLWVSGGSYKRFAALRPFPLPGGDRAIREPRRSALGLLHAVLGDALGQTSLLADAFAPHERRLLLSALSRGVNCPVTTSAGRLL
jgi:hydrogenase maturation protein HypF